MSETFNHLNKDDIKKFLQDVISRVDKAERIREFSVQVEPSFVTVEPDSSGRFKEKALGKKALISIDFGYQEKEDNTNISTNEISTCFDKIDQHLTILGGCDSAMEFAPHFTKPFRAAIEELNSLKKQLNVETKDVEEYFEQ